MTYRVTEIKHFADYIMKRRRAYPKVEDQLDAIWKALDTLGGAAALGPEGSAMLDKVKAVKEKYKKPG